MIDRAELRAFRLTIALKANQPTRQASPAS